MKYYGQKVQLLERKPPAVEVRVIARGSLAVTVVTVQPEIAIALGPTLIFTKRDDPGFKAKSMPSVGVKGFKPPPLPDFSLEARMRWLSAESDRRYRKLNRAHPETFKIAPDTTPEYPWGKR